MVTAVVGGNWGDEGKGKMTDLLAGESDLVVRFQGGANAGHTIINEYGKFVLHILPSGVFRRNATNVIAPGVALNLDSFFQELEMLSRGGVSAPNIMVSERAQIVMPYHILFDRLEEERLGDRRFGSTKSGIAPFYADKYLKTGFQVAELYSDGLDEKISRICEMKRAIAEAVYGKHDEISPEAIGSYLAGFRDRLRPFVGDTTDTLCEANREGKSILLEGQLGALRDPDNGIYPYVTSSSPLAGFGAVGAGLPPYSVQRIVTVVKAYSSCVGAGAFVSEITGDEATELRNRGGDCGEYGATTGRPRRMGWFDIVASRYGCRLQGTTEVALTGLDVLGYLDKIPVCVGYEVDGQVTGTFPVTAKLNRSKPVVDYLNGWRCDIRSVRTYEELPLKAREYVEYIEERLGYPITLLSVGPERDDIIKRNVRC